MRKYKHSLVFFLSCLFIIGCNEPYEKVIATYPQGTPKESVTYSSQSDTTYPVSKSFFHSNGQVYMTGSLDPQGEKHGEWSAYYESGQLWSQGTFEHGIAHGQRVMYHENGVKFGQGRFENGQETGTWEFWDKQGNRLKSKSYGKAAQ